MADAGIGTGHLTAKLPRDGVELWGVDFFAALLVRCRARLPWAKLVQADLAQPLLEELGSGFDRIVSAYVLHEFDLPARQPCSRRWRDGSRWAASSSVIGEVSFATAAEREAARARWADAWDGDDHYSAADEAARALASLGWVVEDEQVSVCAGVYTIRLGCPGG